MTRLRVVVSMLLAALLASAAQADPVAFVVAIKGKVTVVASGSNSPQRAVLGRPLERGDRVQVGDASTASLFFGNGNLIELGPQSSVTVGGKVTAGSAERLGPGSDVSRDVFLKISRYIKGDSKQTGMIALAPMRGEKSVFEPLMLSPRRSGIRSDRPDFQWRSVAGAARYRLKLTESGAETELFHVETAETTAAFPAERAPLAPGADYVIELSVWGEGPITTEETAFWVMTPPESRQVDDHLTSIERASRDSDPEAAHYLAGSYLMGQGLYVEAIPHFEALCRLDPESPGAHEALGNAYRTVGLSDLAAAESKKAVELSRATP